MILLVLLLIKWLHWRRHRHALFTRHGIPGPKPDFWIGNVRDLLSGDKASAYRRWMQQHNSKIIGIWDPQPALVISDIQLIKRIQVKDFNLFPMRHTIVPKGGMDASPAEDVSIVANGLTPGRWKQVRSVCSAAFTPSKVRASLPLVTDAIPDFMDNLRRTESGQDTDIGHLFVLLTVDISATAAFGYHLQVQQQPDHPFLKHALEFLRMYGTNWLNYPLLLCLLFPEFFPVIYPIRRSKMLSASCVSGRWINQRLMDTLTANAETFFML